MRFRSFSRGDALPLSCTIGGAPLSVEAPLLRRWRGVGLGGGASRAAKGREQRPRPLRRLSLALRARRRRRQGDDDERSEASGHDNIAGDGV